MKTVAVLALLAQAVAAPRNETTYYFGTRESHTTVTFESKTEVTNILGATHQATGSATIDAEAGTGSCELSVKTETLNSGMPDRDRAMIGKAWLNAAEFPTIEFKSIKAGKKEGNIWSIDGKFTLRGVTRDITVDAEVRSFPAETGKKLGFGDGPVIKVKTSFKVKFEDYGMKLDDKQLATVQPEITVGLDLWGTAVKPAGAPAVAQKPEEGLPVTVRPPKVSDDGIEGIKYRFGKKPQLATFTATSDAELEKITASSNIVGGVLGLDKDTGKIRLALPVKSLKTGIVARDDHMLGAQWLEGDKFPNIEFESTKAAKKDARIWTVEGKFTMHGVTKEIVLDVTVRELPVELIQKSKWGDTPGMGFDATFKVKLSDFGIKVSEKAIGKVNDEWTLSFSLVALQEAAQ